MQDLVQPIVSSALERLFLVSDTDHVMCVVVMFIPDGVDSSGKRANDSMPYFIVHSVREGLPVEVRVGNPNVVGTRSASCRRLRDAKLGFNNGSDLCFCNHA